MSSTSRSSSGPGPAPRVGRPGPGPGRPPRWRAWILPAGLILLTVFLLIPTPGAATPQVFSYTAFASEVTTNKVATVAVTDTGAVSGTLIGGATYTTTIPTALNDNSLSALLLAHKVAVTGTLTATTSSLGTLLGVLFSLFPFLLMIGVCLWFVRRSRKAAGGGSGGDGRGPLGALMGIGASKATVYDEDRPTTRFADIAGYEGSKAEVIEVVDFLKRPDKYARAGAVGPKGVLMVGPPGTGKTLLARTVAGEAGVPFFALSGSSFVEMFVGVGASRVRSVFADARKRTPSIIFIDEIDAVGGRRGPGGFGSNDEREQTLNQLLSELDGFEPGASVVVIAATNRPEILDTALLRPGRFDRTVETPLPDQRERASILAIHSRRKTLDSRVDLERVSRGTPASPVETWPTW